MPSTGSGDTRTERLVQITATTGENGQPTVFALDSAGRVWRFWEGSGWTALSVSGSLYQHRHRRSCAERPV
jgi:hypothetical protein